MTGAGNVIPMPLRAGSRIEICEVGPRDGFQIEKPFIPTDRKIEIVNGLIDAGLRKVQVTSFVSPRAVPQLADAAEVLAGIDKRPGVVLTALVPNAYTCPVLVKASVCVPLLLAEICTDCSSRRPRNR